MRSNICGKKIYVKIKDYYPLSYKSNKLPNLLLEYFKILDHKCVKGGSIIGGKLDKKGLDNLSEKYSSLNKNLQDPIQKSKEIVEDFFGGALKWRSPWLQYNVGAPVNSIASALYALALDENIYNIDDGLAGNSIVAEIAVSKILSTLAGLGSPATGFFTFGGSATNLYAIKVGLTKCSRESRKKGTPKNARVITTKYAHFSHTNGADWLGIGADNVLLAKLNPDKTTNLEDMERILGEEISRGNIIASIMLNGGTTYDQTIDEIKDFVELRDRIVKKYSLKYKPHIHVDSVIGWSWLFFREYDFKRNPLHFDKESWSNLREQSRKIAQLKYADSWSVDFHKGIGGCPVPCSIILFNKLDDVNLLSKKLTNLETHQLNPEFNRFSPLDYTLETSRPAGAPLSALACLQILGVEGYQRNLGNLVSLSTLTKKILRKEKAFTIPNPKAIGFSTMVRIYPPEFENSPLRRRESDPKIEEEVQFVKKINEYIKAFYAWDNSTRMAKDKGIRYSFSSVYEESSNDTKISALKIYPDSPHLNKKHVKSLCRTIIQQKRLFDKKVWKKS